MAEKIDTWTLCIYFYTVAHLPNKLTINMIAMLISRSKTFKPNKLLKDEWSVDEVEQRYRGFSIEKQNFTFFLSIFRQFSAILPIPSLFPSQKSFRHPTFLSDTFEKNGGKIWHMDTMSSGPTMENLGQNLQNTAKRQAISTARQKGYTTYLAQGQGQASGGCVVH